MRIIIAVGSQIIHDALLPWKGPRCNTNNNTNNTTPTQKKQHISYDTAKLCNLKQRTQRRSHIRHFLEHSFCLVTIQHFTGHKTLKHDTLERRFKQIFSIHRSHIVSCHYKTRLHRNKTAPSKIRPSTERSRVLITKNYRARVSQSHIGSRGSALLPTRSAPASYTASPQHPAGLLAPLRHPVRCTHTLHNTS